MSTKTFFRYSIITPLRLFNLCIIPTLTIYFSQIQEGQLLGFQSLILILHSIRQSTILVLGRIISHILGTKYDKLSSPLKTIFTIGKPRSGRFLKLQLFPSLRSNISFTMDREMPLTNLNISLARKHKLCLCIVTDSFLHSDSSNVECLSLYMILKQTSSQGNSPCRGEVAYPRGGLSAKKFQECILGSFNKVRQRGELN